MIDLEIRFQQQDQRRRGTWEESVFDAAEFTGTLTDRFGDSSLVAQLVRMGGVRILDLLTVDDARQLRL